MDNEVCFLVQHHSIECVHTILGERQVVYSGSRDIMSFQRFIDAETTTKAPVSETTTTTVKTSEERDEATATQENVKKPVFTSPLETQNEILSKLVRSQEKTIRDLRVEISELKRETKTCRGSVEEMLMELQEKDL